MKKKTRWNNITSNTFISKILIFIQLSIEIDNNSSLSVLPEALINTLIIVLIILPMRWMRWFDPGRHHTLGLPKYIHTSCAAFCSHIPLFVILWHRGEVGEDVGRSGTADARLSAAQRAHHCRGCWSKGAHGVRSILVKPWLCNNFDDVYLSLVSLVTASVINAVR